MCVTFVLWYGNSDAHQYGKQRLQYLNRSTSKQNKRYTSAFNIDIDLLHYPFLNLIHS